MKRKFLFALFLAVTLCCNFARAYDAYVYISGNYVPVNVSNNLYKMVFDDDYTYFITHDNDTAALSNTAFTFITFHKVDTPVGIASAKVSTAVITYENDGIRVKSDGTLARVSIIDASGRVMTDIAPRTNDLFFSTAGLPAGIYIVKVSDKADTIVKKVIKSK